MEPVDKLLKVLIVDDEVSQRTGLAGMVNAWGMSADTASEGGEALEKVASFSPDVIVTDLNMPGMDGYQFLAKLKEMGSDAPPSIVLTAFGSIETGVRTVHELGAFWFLEKPVQSNVLQVLLRRAATHNSLRTTNRILERQLLYKGSLGEMVGTSPRMQEPFFAINCAALPETLIESELFGHEKGSFTGASERRAGCFEVAQGGTLLLDEIGEMPALTQAKLLRILEDSKVRRLGGKTEFEVDVRVVAATNKVPEEAVRGGHLREDLYYRLNVFHIHLPPLRERRDDIGSIAEFLIGELNRKHSCKVSDVSQEVTEGFLRHNWPGNVRELRNVLERAVILAGEGTIEMKHLPALLQNRAAAPATATTATATDTPAAPSDSVQFSIGTTVEEAEKGLILRTLEHTKNNKTRAAEILGISLKTLHNKLKEYGSKEATVAV